MILTIYKGTTLLSASYCERQLEELNEKYTLAHIRGYDVTMETFEKEPELQELANKISYYTDMLKKLESDFGKMDEDELIEFITNEMVKKIKQASSIKVSIEHSHVSQYTVMFSIDKIFSTEATFKNKVYEHVWEPNEEYDGYLDTAKEICVPTETAFLKKIISKMKGVLNNKLPNVSVLINSGI